LKDAFKKYISEEAVWMVDEATKIIAREKIDALTAAIGYATIASDDARLDSYYAKVRMFFFQIYY
jgi:predicted metalloendopeptidase